MPGFDIPRLGGYQIENPPDRMDVFWENIQQLNELADGGFRQRSLGYRLRATLTWENNWIRQPDLTGLTTVANDASASITFLPRPNTYAARSFAVIWTNKFEFPYHQGRYGLYGGTIQLVSPNVTSTVGELP